MPADRFLPCRPMPGHDPGEASDRASGREAESADDPAALGAASCLGFWLHELPADRLRVDSPLGEVLGLAPEERAGAPLARLLAAVHGEDRPRAEAMLDAARETGGPFEIEVRARSGRGVRVLRLMGRAEAAGRTLRGLAFDLTEMRLGRGSPPLRAQWQINQVAEHVIALKGLATALDNPALARLVDRVAVEAGFELARRLGRVEDGATH